MIPKEMQRVERLRARERARQHIPSSLRGGPETVMKATPWLIVGAAVLALYFLSKKG